MIDLKKIFQLCLKQWRLFVISLVVCMTIGAVKYFTTPDSFSVDAALMLRQLDGRSSGNQEQMIQMMGGGGRKVVVDEIKVLTSRSIIEPVVINLGLTTEYFQKKGVNWVRLYPAAPFGVQLLEPSNAIVNVKLSVDDGAFDVKVKTGMFGGESFTLKELNQIIDTKAGKIKISISPDIENGSYRANLLPMNNAVAKYKKSVNVARLNRESNIIEISTVSTCPKLAIDVINGMLDMYNLQNAVDKNILAEQTDQFISKRLEVVADELNKSESEMEDYKRANGITNLDEIAATYRKTCDKYDLELADLDARLKLLDYTASEINNEENRNKAFPFVDGNMSNALMSLISEYNSRIARRNALLSNADENHPLVKQETEIINQYRDNIESNIAQERHTLILKRESVEKQRSDYKKRLAEVPEQERVYREMRRTKNTKENQYVYLIEKREENAMIMASAAIPAITVDRAQMNPERVAPKFMLIFIISFLMGLFIPAAYCIGKDGLFSNKK